MSAYARLARLPPPQLAAARRRRRSSSAWSRSRTRMPIDVDGRPDARRSQARRRSARAAADQPDAQRRRRRRARPAAASRVGWQRAAAARCRRRCELWVDDEGPGPVEHRQPVRAVLHDQARRLGHRPGAEPADRRGPRRHADAGEPRRRPRLPRHAAAAASDAPALGRRRSRRTPNFQLPTPKDSQRQLPIAPARPERSDRPLGVGAWEFLGSWPLEVGS